MAGARCPFLRQQFSNSLMGELMLEAIHATASPRCSLAAAVGGNGGFNFQIPSVAGAGSPQWGPSPGLEGHPWAASQALISAMPSSFCQGLQPLQRQAANQAFLLRAQGPPAVAPLTQYDLGFSLGLSSGFS